jgi:hypothetical protein
MEYIAAIKRHCDRIIEGEWIDGASEHGASHIGCIGQTAGIIADARLHGTLTDDRPSPTGPSNASALLDEIEERLKHGKRERANKREDECMERGEGKISENEAARLVGAARSGSLRGC